MKKNICRLCGVVLDEKNRCSSHIIPEFIWRDYMTNEKGHYEEMVVLKENNNPPRFLKKYGLVDDSILCRKCDNEIFGKYENDFKEVWERVFKNGELLPLMKGNELRGWATEIVGYDDVIKTKLFVLACVWRASVSTLEDYPIKLNERKEKAIKKVLLNGGNKKLLHSYSMICTRFEDGYPLAIPPYYERNNKKKNSLVRFYLPFGYAFTVRLGVEEIDRELGAAEFGAFDNAFYIANMGKFDGSLSAMRLLKSAIKGMQNMFFSDKQK